MYIKQHLIPSLKNQLLYNYYLVSFAYSVQIKFSISKQGKTIPRKNLNLFILDKDINMSDNREMCLEFYTYIIEDLKDLTIKNF